MSKLIFDIGMHTGKDSEFYLKKGFNVIAIEANPKLVEKAKVNFKEQIDSGQLVIINKAIAPGNIENIDFYINDDKDDWGTIVPEWNRSLSSNFYKITVPTTGLEEIIKTYGLPYYMKIDIEGADVLCLKQLLELKLSPDYLSIELLTPNNLKEKKVDSLEILIYLYCLGYRKFQVVDQSKNQETKPPKVPLEGVFIEQAFDGHSSGLFGKEIRSEFYSIDEISKMYLDYFYKKENIVKAKFKELLKKLHITLQKPVFNADGWFDVHASK